MYKNIFLAENRVKYIKDVCSLYSKKDYSAYVDTKAPKSPILKNCIWAFFIGGLICVFGQFLTDMYNNLFNLELKSAKTFTSITLIFLSAILTGLNIYPKIAKRAGAGTLVPITGFANAIVSPSVEFKKEGFVLGTAAKMFTIAGPVIAYGVSSSFVIGFIYWLFKILNG